MFCWPWTFTVTGVYFGENVKPIARSEFYPSWMTETAPGSIQQPGSGLPEAAVTKFEVKYGATKEASGRRGVAPCSAATTETARMKASIRDPEKSSSPCLPPKLLLSSPPALPSASNNKGELPACLNYDE